MSLKKRLGLLLVIDFIIIIFSAWVSNLIFEPLLNIDDVTVMHSLILMFFYGIFANLYGLYRKVWEYASVREIVTIFKAVSLSIVGTVVVQNFTFGWSYNRVLVVTWMLQLILIGGSRFAWRLLRDRVGGIEKTGINTLIIGAGAAGEMLTRQLQKNRKGNLNPIAFLDDDVHKHGLEILGLLVYGSVERLEEIVKEREIQHIIIAIPSLERNKLADIYALCAKTKVKTQILPRIEDIVEGKVSVSLLKDVSVEDLLGRDSVKLDDKEIRGKLYGKTVLVTGAGGSIGSEICRQAMRYQPERLVLLGHGENSIYTIEMDLLETYGDSSTAIIPEIADVQDREKIFSIIEKYRPDVIYHAAAHKHVPLMERNPEEAVKNNTLGTKNVAEAAHRYGVGTFVMVSTDKAVNPTNVMGATKRVAEMVVQSLNPKSATRFVAVRFGNVLGSRGSVIPRFKAQIAKGGPITVTHPDMIRYFMTIPEASRLVIQAGAFAKGGEIFVLDMGAPVKIVDLARNLITLSGLTEEEVGIEFSGIRPGEKLYEELLMSEEGLDKTTHDKIFVGNSINMAYEEVLGKLKVIEEVLSDGNLVREKLKEMVPTYVEGHEQKNVISLVKTDKEDQIVPTEKVATSWHVQTAGEFVR